MRHPDRRWRVIAVVSLILLQSLWIGGIGSLASASAQGVDLGLCDHDPARVAIPSDLVIDACFDGGELVLVNRTEFVVNIETLGSASGWIRDVFTNYGIAEAIIRASTGEFVLPPGYRLTTTVGPGPVDVRVGVWDENVSYFWVRFLVGFIPLPVVQGYEIATDFGFAVDRAFRDYSVCKEASSNVYLRSSCLADAISQVAGEVALLVAELVDFAEPAALTGAIIKFFKTGTWALSSTTDLLLFNEGSTGFTIAALGEGLGATGQGATGVFQPGSSWTVSQVGTYGTGGEHPTPDTVFPGTWGPSADWNSGGGDDDCDMPVLAPSAGTVEWVRDDPTRDWGNAIVWTNASDTEKIFMAHLDSVVVHDSDSPRGPWTVQAGDVIATVGKTGKGSGTCHLHVNRTVKIDGTWVGASPYVDGSDPLDPDPASSTTSSTSPSTTTSSALTTSTSTSTTTTVSVDPYMSVSPSSGSTSTNFSGSGSGFTPGGSVRLTFWWPSGGQYPQTFTKTASASGTISFGWVWESGDEYGQYKVRATDLSTNEVSPYEYFTINAPAPTVDPYVDVSPSSGSTSTNFSGSGSGFTPGGSVRLTFWWPSGGQYPQTFTKTASASGTISFGWVWESGDEYGQYKVRATDLSTNEVSPYEYFTINSSATVPGTPGAPSVLPGDAQVSLSWSAPSNGGSAILYYHVDMEGPTTAKQVSGTSYTWTGLSNGTTYRFAVRACNAVGCGGWSNWSPYVTPTGGSSVNPQATVSPSSGTSANPRTNFSLWATGLTPGGSYRLEVWDGGGVRRWDATHTANSSGDSQNHTWYWESGEILGQYRVRFTDLSSGEYDDAYFTISQG